MDPDGSRKVASAARTADPCHGGGPRDSVVPALGGIPCALALVCCTLSIWLVLPGGAASGVAANSGSPKSGSPKSGSATGVVGPHRLEAPTPNARLSEHPPFASRTSPSSGDGVAFEATLGRDLPHAVPRFPRFDWGTAFGGLPLLEPSSGATDLQPTPSVEPTRTLDLDRASGSVSASKELGALDWGPALAQATGEDSGSGSDGGSVPAAEERTYPGYRRDAAREHLARYKDMTDRSIDRGLRYLSERQADAGHFSAKYSVAVTALGGMAMLGNGITYGRGAYGYDVRQAVEYLTSPAIQKHNGYITEGESTDTPSKMHGHTYAILFLSQVVGTLPDPKEDAAVRRVVERGVKLIIDSQTARGGWGYEPGDDSDEASLTVCALQALRAAKDAGFHVPLDTIRGAVRYLKESCKEDGSFRYSLTRGSRESTYELTAAAVSTLDAAGEYGMAEHARGVEFMRKTLFASLGRKGGALDAASGYPYYGNLYAGQVYFQLGGELWETWSQEAWPEMLRRQKANGSWESRFGSEYATAVALLILEIPRGYLPIFER